MVRGDLPMVAIRARSDALGRYGRAADKATLVPIVAETCSIHDATEP
jgi:hypothetical protein